MNISINFSTLQDIVGRSLSIIGKRSVDDKGNLLFKDITIGTNERIIIDDFLSNGLSDLLAELSHFVRAQYNDNINNIVYTNWWQKEDVSEDLITASGMLWYKTSTNTLYESLVEEDPEHEIERQASWSETTPDVNTAYVNKDEVSYLWREDYGTMERVGNGIGHLVVLDLTMHDNWNTALQPSFSTTIQNYLVAYTLYSWFVITAPRIAEKYQGDMARQLATLIRLLHEKKTPESSGSSPLDVSTNVSSN